MTSLRLILWFVGGLGAAGVGWFAWPLPVSSSNSPPRLLPVASIEEVLTLIADGKRVVFVDAREPEEFAESHIPGAINVPLRAVATIDPALLADPDLVIAYCLKDFRGFEVARALHQSGTRNVATLAEFGINGWRRAGLPVASSVLPESDALAQLMTCARNPESCQLMGPRR